MYNTLRDELYKRQLSNTEAFDKAVLSLSSAGLAISLTFIKFITPLEFAEYIGLLYASWILFGLSIVTTISSLISSQIGIDVQLKNAEEYYINEKEDFLNKKNIAANITSWLNRASALFFVVAIVSVISFVIINFNESKKIPLIQGENVMSKIKVNDGAAIPVKQQINEGAPIPVMQKVMQKGATIPTIQQVQPSQPSSQQGSSQSSTQTQTKE